MRTHSLSIAFASVILFAWPICTIAQESRDVGALIARLNDDDKRVREDAAEGLAEILDSRIPPLLRNRVAEETDFHVKLALHYALASQGDKQALQFLIDSLRQTGHMGANYLGYATPEDYEWKIDQWQKWFDETSDQEFLAFIRERRKRKPMMEEWSEFASLYGKRFLGSLTNAETGEPAGFVDRMTKEEIRRLSELPTAEAWNLFESAIDQLQDKGNRKESARLFRKIATEFSNTYYADESKELADLLEKMVAEDAEYTPPIDIASLEIDQQIDFHIHNLRDVVAHQFSQPGYCRVLSQLRLSDDERYNAAGSLRDIGKPAIPRLISLLDDRRPIRAVGYWRDFHPTRTVLRYQDAAIQIIEAIQAGSPYDRRTTSSYFSTERPETQKAVIESLKSSAKSK